MIFADLGDMLGGAMGDMPSEQMYLLGALAAGVLALFLFKTGKIGGGAKGPQTPAVKAPAKPAAAAPTDATTRAVYQDLARLDQLEKDRQARSDWALRQLRTEAVLLAQEAHAEKAVTFPTKPGQTQAGEGMP